MCTFVDKQFKNKNMNELIEEWRNIKSYEGLYQVSNLGRIKSIKFTNERILKNEINNCGYSRIDLSNNGIQKRFLIHRLVYNSFIGEIPINFVCNHIDGKKSNNCINNLDIVSFRDNLSSDKCCVKNSENFTSKLTGVNFHKSRNKYQSRIFYLGKLYYLGIFNTQLEAKHIYIEALENIKNNTFENYITNLKQKNEKK